MRCGSVEDAYQTVGGIISAGQERTFLELNIVIAGSFTKD